jgi:hypothetical protein
MLYIRLKNGKAVETSGEYPRNAGVEGWARNKNGTFKKNGWLNRNDIESFEIAKRLAEELTESTGYVFLPADKGPNVSPQFDVIAAPCVGDEVSRGFNGDYYPCGKIVKITPTWQITTSDGTKFRRVGDTASWRQTGRGFWMVGGVHDERNPHF